MSGYSVFNQTDWGSLQEKAISSFRKRAHFNLHKSYDEPLQRTLICLLHGTYIPPHYHRHLHQKELFVVLSGEVKVLVFESSGKVLDIQYLSVGEMIEISADTIHTVVCLTDSAFVLEAKQGPFVADDCKEFLDWTISENDTQSNEYVTWLYDANVGSMYE
jgi:cupin fold WbuC family metalloprotein